MIFRTDILQASDSEVAASLWQASTDKQTHYSGFKWSKLHRVYKRLNREGYEFVSITCWEDVVSYQRSRADAGCYAYLTCSDGPVEGGLYSVVNGGRNPREVSRSDNLVVTNPYRIASEDAAKYAQMWEASKNHMEGMEGFVNATLFQTLGCGGQYHFVSRAEWRSEALFMRQFEGRDFKAIIASFESIFSICLSQVVSEVRTSLAA